MIILLHITMPFVPNPPMVVFLGKPSNPVSVRLGETFPNVQNHPENLLIESYRIS